MKALAQGDIVRAKARFGGDEIEWVDDSVRPEAGSLGLVVLDHVLQTLPYTAINQTLELYAGLLGPGGQLVVIVPSLEWACEQYVRHDDPSVAAFVALYGIPGAPNLCGFNLLQLRVVVAKLPGLRLVSAASEWYEAQVQGKTERVLQNTVAAVRVGPPVDEPPASPKGKGRNRHR